MMTFTTFTTFTTSTTIRTELSDRTTVIERPIAPAAPAPPQELCPPRVIQLRVDVEDILLGVRGSENRCPIRRALTRYFMVHFGVKVWTKVRVGEATVRFGYRLISPKVTFFHNGGNWIVGYDQSETYCMLPTTVKFVRLDP